MRAIILAGGLGTRLKSVVSDLPKPLAPIQQKPFLAYLLDYLQSQGVTNVVLSLGFQAQKIQDYFQSRFGAIGIDYVIETTPLGTGGAMRHALQLFADDSEPVFVLNGDTLLKADLHALYDFHQQYQSALTMALCRVENAERYGLVTVKGNSIIAFREKGKACAGLINAGVYLMSPSLLNDYHDGAVFSFERDFLPNAKVVPHAFITEDYFIDIGSPDDYQRAKVELA